MRFKELIALFEQTQVELQRQAARSVDVALVVRNWLFGGYIVGYEQHGEDRAEYGAETLIRLSEELTNRLGRGFSVDNLELMRRFFAAYRQEFISNPKSETAFRILQEGSSETPRISSSATLGMGVAFSLGAARAMSAELTSRFSLGWSHYVTLLTINDPDERRFYEIEACTNNWSIRELKRQIAASLYERLALSRDKKKVKELAEKGQLVGAPADIIKSPYVLEFLGLDERASYSEYELETALIDKLEHFLLELGKGFLFEARQKRFTFDDDHFYVDLVFYNRLLRCYVLIDLKRGKLTHQNLGQMQMYVNYFDRHVKLDDENPTVGIILCRTQNDALVELTLPEGQQAVYARQYQLYLPDKAVLRQRLVQWSEELESQQQTPTTEPMNR